MATSLKTVAFPFPNLSTITDKSTNNFTQITVDLPESSKVFKKVWIEFMCNDIITVTGGTLNEWRLACQLGAAGYSTVTNTNDLTHSGENLSLFNSQDFTAYFTTNWTGNSMTCDCQVYIDQSTGTTLGNRSGSAILYVTYEYDDTSSTQVYSCWIPMTSATGALPSSKGAAQDTVPNLDSFLGYGSISYKHIMMIMEGNEANNAGTTDFVVSVQLDTTTQQNGDTHETALATDRYVREHFNLMSGGSPIFTTNATHSFYAWISTGAVTRMNHASFTMLVTFTFDATSSNQGNRSLLIPFRMESPAGNTTSSDYQRSNKEDLFIAEGNVSTQKSACRWYWTQVGAVATANFRCGSQSFVAITDTAAVLGGGNCHQRTCDDNITLARGRNVLTSDVYNSDTTDKMWSLSGMWIINYKCDKPSGGWGQANRTVVWPLLQIGTGTSVSQNNIAAEAITIPETSYYLSHAEVEVNMIGVGTNTYQGISALVERLSAEGGVRWENVILSILASDAEIGLYKNTGCACPYFKHFPSDANPLKFDIETARRWRIYSVPNLSCWMTLSVYATYHAITYTVSGTISNSAGGTVNLYLHKADANTNDPGELLLTGTRSGNGAYSFTWYDDVESVVVVAYESATYKGASKQAAAGSGFDISLSTPAGSATYSRSRVVNI